MQAYKNDFLPDINAIEADVRAPLTVEELRNRLKHIASLCWGLSIDLSTEMSECEKVRKENEKLREQVVRLGGKIPNSPSSKSIAKMELMPPEERAKHEAHLRKRREYTQAKRKEEAKAAYAGASDGNS